MLSVCEYLRWHKVIQISLVMLSRRENEIQNARKEQKKFGVLKLYKEEKNKVVYLMET